MTNTHNGTILVADDDQKLCYILSANLRAEGYDVLTTFNGHEAVQLARQIQPHIIILDVTMPGLSGVDVLRELKSNPETAHIPIIMLTARSEVEDLVAGLDSGAEEYLTKPFEMAELLVRIRSIRRLADARDELSSANKSLTEEVLQKTHRLEVLYRYARRLNEAKSRDAILSLAVEAVRDATEAKRISIFLPDESRKQLHCAKAVGLPHDVAKHLAIDSGGGIAGRVYTTRKTIVANAYGETADGEERYKTDAFLSAPLISAALTTQDEALGVINVTEKADGKPFAPEEIECIRSIASMCAVALHNQIRRTQLEGFVHGLLLTVGRLAEFRDYETAEHLERVQDYAEIVVKELRKNPKYAELITDEYIENLIVVTPMHDIGKVGVPDDILLKPGPLSPQEFEVMKRHVEIGRETLELATRRIGMFPLLEMSLDVICGHHEKWDGSGYPEGRSGEEIPLAARIVALVDAYDAITSRRPYKEPLPHERALEIIRADSGKHFDPDVVEAFLAQSDEFDRIRAEKQSEVDSVMMAMP